MPVVYADVVWLVNFVMDVALLTTAGWISKRPLRTWRILLGACIGSVYSMLLFIPALSTLTTWPGKAVASLVMVYLAIPCRSWLDLARNSAVYYFVAFIFAGAAIAMHYAVPGVSIAGGVIVGGRRLAYLTSAKSLALLVAIPLSVVATRFALTRVHRLSKLSASLYTLEIILADKSVQCVGLADTGNHLRHPVTGKPVCLVEIDVLQTTLPEVLCQAILKGQPVYDVVPLVDVELASRLTMVPFRGAGGADQWLIAFRPDSVFIVENGVKRPAACPCLIGIHRSPLSSDHRFQAILHIDVITGDDRFEDADNSSQHHQTPASITTVVDAHPPEVGWRP